ncbi:MAG: hypothetical protein HWN81_00630 [Candidatus Lokiarchaeota archaeon]|nr:hypothetical protein [Candidatus Lokiarchaeota archaeon]
MKRDKFYYLDGSILNYYDDTKKLHRLDGPAIEYASGSKWWYVKGKRHRLDGPAVEFSSGSKRWWVNGKYLTEEEFETHPKRYDYLASLAIEEILNERK